MKRPINLSPDVIHLIWSHWRKGDADEESILRRVLGTQAAALSSTTSLSLIEDVLLDQTPGAEDPVLASSNEYPAPSKPNEGRNEGPSGGGKMRWVDDVVVALRNLGGEADLPEIYKEVERVRRKGHRSIVRSLDATVRQTIEAHSNPKDSKNYRDGNEQYFIWVGRGRWKLR